MDRILAVTADALPYSWNPACPVSWRELALVQFTHVDFQGRLREGSLVVLAELAPAVLEIMDLALTLRFPIHIAVPIDAFFGDDDASMSANNSSGFNFRPIAGTSQLSLHLLGRAVDINPVLNPYQQQDLRWSPPEGVRHLDRSKPVPGMFTPGHPIVAAFEEHGFEWGGTWERPDYHHFQVTP